MQFFPRRVLESSSTLYISQLTDLESSVLPSLEKDHSEKSQTLSKLQTTSSKARTEQARVQSELDSVRRLVPRAGKVAHLKAALKELDRRISNKAGSIGGGGGAMRSQVIVNRDLKDANRAA